MPRLIVLTLAVVAVFLGPKAFAADQATEKAKSHYEIGLKQFESGNRDAALVEFQTSNEIKPRPATLFMMAQCEYLLGQYKSARDHYAQYQTENPTGDFVDLARDRVASINRLKSTFVITTIPDSVDVNIEGPAIATPIRGRAPSSFQVPPGHYRIQLSKPQHQTVTAEADIDIVENRPLLFKLDPVAAHLEITTVPKGARLFVNGNLVRNPYKQTVTAGRFEIRAEAGSYNPTEKEVVIAAGETHKEEVQLDKYQESGHKGLWAWSTFLGMVAGGASVAALVEDPSLAQNPATTGVIGAGAVVGGIAGIAASVILVPDYIPDNQALWIMGGEWMGAAEGLALGLSFRPGLRPAVIGGLSGFALGTTGSWLLRDRAPNYGRAAVIQSGAIIGASVGALTPASLRIDEKYSGPLMLAGLNLGLGAGLALAYLPDQRRYGPTWRRVMLIDGFAAAGALIGALISAVQGCVDPDPVVGCTFPFKTADDRARTARLSLGVGLVGLGAGIFLTHNVDRSEADAFTRPRVAPAPVSFIPTPTVLVVQDDRGGSAAIPALAAIGRF